MSEALGRDLGRLLRELAPEVLAIVLRRHRDFALAEDALQEALVAAAAQWPAAGVPDDARAWLVHVASRRVIDQARSESARRRREQLVVSLVPPEDQLALAPDDAPEGDGDDTMLLLFMCCHPSLTRASAMALTLRAIAGLTTAEIAAAFLVPEATMAQRISRAKQTIASSGVPFERPSPAETEERLASVLHVLYLVFNEGYAASHGAAVHRADLADEAIRLTRLLRVRLPEDGAVAALLALLLLTDARRAARTDARGGLVTLDEQDRTRWDRAKIEEGLRLAEEGMRRAPGSPYAIQAAIAALHDEAESTETTDWPQILALYEVLAAREPENPVIALNVAVATAMVGGPRAGLAKLEQAARDPRLSGSHRVEAARGHLLERAGERGAAIAAYRRAAEATTSLAERDYLLARAARLEA
ncbi:MAG: DUF6596 domain-containing protein [Sandaracinus sp.]